MLRSLASTEGRGFVVTVLLIVHGLLSVALLGAVTHQALAASSGPGRRGSFFGRFRSVDPALYTRAILVLYVVTAILGGILYATYRLEVRPLLEDLDLPRANGAFETKEHFAALGLGLLPAYWACWQSRRGQSPRDRELYTWTLALIVWAGFLIGHVLNNIKGLYL